jgi:hypothetical protein
MGLKKINDEDWEFNISLVQINLDKTYTLSTDSLLTVKLYNSFDAYFPRLKIEYADFGFTLSNVLENNQCIINIRITEPTSDLNEHCPLYYQGTFIVADIKILNQTKDYITYEIICEHINRLKLLSNVNYTNDKTQR